MNCIGTRSHIAALAVSTVFGAAQVYASEINTGNPDLTIRWDNTLKYNYAYRVEGQNSTILASPNYDDGDRNFEKGTVSNRLDVLTQFDLIYHRRMGFRVSAAGWFDDAYSNLDNDSLVTSNHIRNGVPALGLSKDADRFHKGPSGEVLDAFVFTRVDVGDKPLNLKLGRHTVFWGESVLNPIHGVGYGQAPLDLRKSLSVPGISAQELLLPRNAFSAQIQLTSEFSLATQYFLDWEQYRLPEAGSFLGAYDMVLDGGESLIAGPGIRFRRGKNIEPHKRGDWGVAARWSPDWLEGTVGLYYRDTSDIQPQLLINPLTGSYHQVYADGIKVLGMSLSKNIGGVSVGADLSYRHDMPLNSEAAVSATLPLRGDAAGAVGNTWHGVLSLLGTVQPNALFDSASWITELQWNRYARVSRGEDVFKGRSSYEGVDKVSKDFYGLSLSFVPVWYQAFPGIDLEMPIAYNIGLSGTSAVAAGGNEHAGNYSIGLSADVYQKYKVDLKYTDFVGSFDTNGTGMITSDNGMNSVLKDRGFVSLTLKTTF